MSDFDEPDAYWQFHERREYSRFINVSGTMTGLGGSIVRRSIRAETEAAMARFVKIHDLQTHASKVISKLTGAEAGCITASASAGITVAVAAAITDLDLAKVEALPNNPGERHEVAVQLGHLCGYGAPISTAIELAGGTVRTLGQSTLAMDYQLDAALTEATAAALYVVSHHVVHYGQIPLERFCEIVHGKNLPVIVDAASEYDLERFLAKGVDLVIYSGQKFLGGPTAGIIAGRRDLVRACYLQNTGIARGMKVGKESIAGVIAALEAWSARDHAAVRAEERKALNLWFEAVADLSGIDAKIVPDPTGNPLDRLQINVDSDVAGASAASFARALGDLDPAIIVRNYEVELGYFQLDPCNLAPGQAEMVAASLATVLSDGAALKSEPNDLNVARNAGVDGYLAWLAQD